MGFPPAMALRGGAFPIARLEPGRDAWERQGRFPALPRADGQLGRVALGALL